MLYMKRFIYHFPLILFILKFLSEDRQQILEFTEAWSNIFSNTKKM